MSLQTRTELAQVIDHTLLTPTATRADVETLCVQARTHGFHSVCVGPRWVSLAADLLADCPVKVATVVGFPLGFETSDVKAQQAKAAVFDGADEIEAVADLGAVIEQDTRLLTRQFHALTKVCTQVRPAVTLKIIVESAALSKDQIAMLCSVAQRVGVDSLKTSTGFHDTGNATVEDVEFMRAQAPACQICASGEIQTLDQAIALLQAGATRLSTSHSVTLVNALPQEA